MHGTVQLPSLLLYISDNFCNPSEVKVALSIMYVDMLTVVATAVVICYFRIVEYFPELLR